MTLNYTTLQSEVLAIAHRAALTTEVAGFIRRAEARIKNLLTAYPLTAELDESDRSANGVYTLPSGFLQVRSVSKDNAEGVRYQLRNAGVSGISQILSTNPVIYYAVLSRTQIEFRGVPDTDVSLYLEYLGIPDALADTATNALLTYDEGVYIHAALCELYWFTQDLELAATHNDQFKAQIERLNEQYGRMAGGAEDKPAYNFGHTQTGTGY